MFSERGFWLPVMLLRSVGHAFRITGWVACRLGPMVEYHYPMKINRNFSVDSAIGRRMSYFHSAAVWNKTARSTLFLRFCYCPFLFCLVSVRRSGPQNRYIVTLPELSPEWFHCFLFLFTNHRKVKDSSPDCEYLVFLTLIILQFLDAMKSRGGCSLHFPSNTNCF